MYVGPQNPNLTVLEISFQFSKYGDNFCCYKRTGVHGYLLITRCFFTTLLLEDEATKLS